MTKIDLLLTANLRISAMKTVRLLAERSRDYSSLLLPYPEEMEAHLDNLASKRISYQEVIDGIIDSQIIPEPVGAWVYTAEPLLKALPHIREKHPDLRVLCVGNLEDEYKAMEISASIACHTLNALITGRIEHDRWREALRDSIERSWEATRGLERRILMKVSGNTVCVLGLSFRPVKKFLVDAGHHVSLKYVDGLYHFTPVTILERKLVLSAVDGLSLEALVRGHLEYVRNYVYRYESRDRAHFEWTYDKASWLRHGLDIEEIKQIDSFTQTKWS
jgi:hypothetical protein